MGKLYNRADIVNFIKVGEGETYKRMTGFTENTKSLNPETYERRYVDEKSQRKDTTGYATEISYNFDREIGNAVHEAIAEIHDKEIAGATVEIVTVNMNVAGTAANTFKAKKRIYSVLPDSDGDGTDAYQYSGTFAAQGDIIEGTASSTDSFKTITFTPDIQNAQLVTFNVSDTAGQIEGAKIIIGADTIYTDANGIATISLVAGTYSNIEVSKEGYTTQSDISVTVENAAVYKEITLVEAE